jgi:hypothetical protein
MHESMPSREQLRIQPFMFIAGAAQGYAGVAEGDRQTPSEALNVTWRASSSFLVPGIECGSFAGRVPKRCFTVAMRSVAIAPQKMRAQSVRS